jgi:hypothetical protein
MIKRGITIPKQAKNLKTEDGAGVMEKGEIGKRRRRRKEKARARTGISRS